MTPGLEKIELNLDGSTNRLTTPCYVYDVEAVLQNYRDLREGFGTPLILSLKANSCVDLLLRIHHVLADGIEVASLGELGLVVGSTGGEIFLNSPAYDCESIRAGAASKATLVVDNLMQLEAVGELASKRNVRPILLRINHAVLERFGAPRSRPDYLGFQWEDFRTAMAEASRLGVLLAGLHVFKGSYSFSADSGAFFAAIGELMSEVPMENGSSPCLVNVGGGLGERWRESDVDFDAYRTGMSHSPAHVQIVHEAGRAVFGSAGYFLTSTRYIKRGADGWVVVCDGGISSNFLLCGTESAFRRYREPYVLPGDDASRECLDVPARVIGPSCSRDDVIGELPAGAALPRPGDVLVFDYCGAYNRSYSVTKFLLLPEATEYVL